MSAVHKCPCSAEDLQNDPRSPTTFEEREADATLEQQIKVVLIGLEIAKNERDLDQCDETIGKYNREFLYNVRDLEQLLDTTAVDQMQLMQCGISRFIPRKTMKRELFWTKPLVVRVINVMDKAQTMPPVEWPYLIYEFLNMRLHDFEDLNEVVLAMLYHVLDQPCYVGIFCQIAHAQVLMEERENKEEGFGNLSLFRNSLLSHTQETFTRMITDKSIESSIDEEPEDNHLEITLISKKIRFIEVIGNLYLYCLISVHILNYCIVELLKSVTKDNEGRFPIDGQDDDAVECAIRLLKVVGKRLHEENLVASAAATARDHAKYFPLDSAISTLKDAMPIVSEYLRFSIMKLVELHDNGWKSTNIEDEGTIEIVITRASYQPSNYLPH